VYRDPGDRFVASFLGTPAMNFLDAEAARVHLPVPDGVTLGVRPEHLRLGSEGTATRVDLVEVAGSEAYVHLENGLVAHVPTAARPAEGAEVHVAFRREDAYLFDAVSGERVSWA
jgi:ABC-type sugar transport system ATPase subunit